MLDQVRKLIKHSAVYGMGLIGSSITGLVLTPVLLHRLNRAEYGMNEVLNVFNSMVLFIATLGIAAVLIKIYLNDCETENDRKTLISSVMIFSGIVGLLLILLTIFSSSALSKLFFSHPGYGSLVLWGITGSALMLVQQITVLCLRAKQMPGKFTAVTLTQLAVVIAANFYLVWYCNKGVLGVQIGAVAGASISLILGLYMIRSDLVLRFSPRMLKYVLKLSLPLIPTAIVPWILNWSDRFFLNHYCGLEQTGIYAVGYKIGMLGIVLPINAFQLAWSPLFFSNSSNSDISKFCANILKYYVLILAGCGILISVYAREIIDLISTSEYSSAYMLVPFISLAYIFYGIQFYTVPFFIQTNKGKWLANMMMVVAAANLTLNYMLIPRIGITGAVISTCITFFLEAVLGLWLAGRLFPVQYDHSAFVKLIVSAGIVYYMFVLTPFISHAGAVIKLSSVPAFLGLLFISRFFSDKELELIYSLPVSAIRRVNPRYRKAA